MVRCANCKRQNPEGALLCEYCGEPIDPDDARWRRETDQFRDDVDSENRPRWGTARFSQDQRLLLHINGQHELTVDVHRSGGVVIGRFDPDRARSPDVDLTPYGAAELGVSRRHARLEVQDQTLRIIDLGSANGTYANGMRLIPNKPRILRDGDEVRLGRMRMYVFFVDKH